MYWGHIAVITLTLLASLGAAGSALAQQIPEPPQDPPVQLGPVVLAPVFRLTNLGHDSNVFNLDDNDNPQDDITATAGAVLDGWLRLSHARVTGRGQVDYYYFRELTDLRGVDFDTRARLDVPLNRLIPYGTGTYARTHHRQNLEIDSMDRRTSDGVTLGVDVRVTPRATAGIFARRGTLEYEENSLYLDTDLSQTLNRTERGEGVTFRYQVTTFTTVGVDFERSRDRFEFESDRDADSQFVTPVVEFNPLAVISGRASVGFQRRRVLSGTIPDFEGTVALVDLSYTLLGHTRFTVSVRRGLEYSYLVDATDYLETGAALSVTHRIGDSWDVGGSIGRSKLSYQLGDGQSSGATPTYPDETVQNWSLDAGYALTRTRFGFHLERWQRRTDEPTASREYHRLRVGSTVTYTF